MNKWQSIYRMAHAATGSSELAELVLQEALLDAYIHVDDGSLRENMRRAANGGFINATDCADYLVKKGLPFRTAYTIVGKTVNYCIQNGKTLDSLSLGEYRQFSDVFDDDVYEFINLDTCVNKRNVPGGPAEKPLRAQLDYIADFLNERE